MTIASVGTLGNGVSTASSASVSLTVSANAEAGNLVMVAVALDNITAADGSSSNVTSVTDSAGNTYTKLGEHTNDAGGAGTGVTVALFYTKVGTQLNSGAGTITANFSGSITSKAISAWEYTMDGSALVVDGTQTEVVDAADAGNLTIGSLSATQRLFFRVVGREAATVTLTPTAGATAISRGNANTGTAATSINVNGEFAITAATSVSSNPTESVTSNQGASIFFALREVYELSADAGSFTITGEAATFGVSLEGTQASFAITGADADLVVSESPAEVRARATALHERRPGVALEFDIDYCANTFGVSPCTAGRMDTGTAQAGGASSITLALTASAVDDAYNGMTVRVTGGTGSGQERKVGDYVGATKVATVTTAWTTPPDGTSTYTVIDRANGCYQAYLGDSPCQDQASYVRGTKTVKFCGRGMPIPPGEQYRPYIIQDTPVPTEIDPVKGLAARSSTSFTMADEPARDDLDRYIDDRATPAGGTWWTRFIARFPNAVGRFARARRGYVVEPWDWLTFQTELFVIEAVKGPLRDGRVQVTLTDAVKLLDRIMLPAATGGKLQAQLGGPTTSGTMQSGSTSTTAVLSTSASAVDDAYNGQEIYITGGLGVEQRRVVTDYVGSTRTATVAAWDVTPNNTSLYEVAPLSLNVGSGKGSEYRDPATTGKQEFVCIGDEVIRYTSLVGDVLSWTDGTYRAQYGTSRATHNASAGVQQCLAYVAEDATAVVQNMLNRGGITDAYIDTAKLGALEAQWYGAQAQITACITHPAKGSELLADLLQDLNMMQWWHPVEQMVKFETNMPQLGGADSEYADSEFIAGSVEVERMDKDRLTRAALYYDLISATADKGKETSYRTVDIFIDTTAESVNGYGDQRADVRRSKWMKSGNSVFCAGVVGRRLRTRVSAPIKIKAALDPRTEPVLGQQVDITTRRLVGADGQPLTVLCRVVKLTDHGEKFAAEFLSTNFGARYGFIQPNGVPNYLAANSSQRLRAFIANNSGLMGDGTGAYFIL